MRFEFLRRYAAIRIGLFVGLLAAGLAGLGHPALAQIGSDRYASIVIDSQSGNVLTAANPDEYRYPASLTKLMTMYLLFEQLRDGRLTMNDLVPVSASAAAMPPTKLGLTPGMTLTVQQAVLGLVTKSANDAAAALGELMGGDEEHFAEIMTMRARSLGMMHTNFRNASGLPDWGQVTTARDLAILARHLIQDFPNYYYVFSTPYFQFHGRTVLSHQHMLQTYPGADGMKTGYIEASGYNVVTSALRGNVRLIGVVLGAANGSERDLHMASLLDQGFDRMGVPPIQIARQETAPYRLPLFGVARAATLPPHSYPVQVAEARPIRPRYGKSYAEYRVAPRRVPEYRPAVPVRPAHVAVHRPYAADDEMPRARPPRPAPTRTAHGQGWSRYPS